MLVCAPAAVALSARGDVFELSFGVPGSGNGQLTDPSGVAVDEATGEVYVVDAGNERVETFRPAGGGGYEYVSQFKVRSPGAIAVNNSTSAGDPSRGEVFVVAAEEKAAPPEERDLVDVYDPGTGTIIHKLHVFGEQEEELEDISGVAVNPTGTLWVYWETEGIVDAFAKEATRNGALKLVWQPSSRRTPEIELQFECSARAAFAGSPGR